MTTSADRSDVAADAELSDLPACAAALAGQLRERAGTLPPDVVGGLESARMFHLGLPRGLGGFEPDPATPVRFSLVQDVVPRDDVPDLLYALIAVLGRAARSTS